MKLRKQEQVYEQRFINVIVRVPITCTQNFCTDAGRACEFLDIDHTGRCTCTVYDVERSEAGPNVLRCAACKRGEGWARCVPATVKLEDL